MSSSLCWRICIGNHTTSYTFHIFLTWDGQIVQAMGFNLKKKRSLKRDFKNYPKGANENKKASSLPALDMSQNFQQRWQIFVLCIVRRITAFFLFYARSEQELGQSCGSKKYF